MKDFIFTDPSESTTRIVFRTDLIGATNNNFSIMQITNLSETSTAIVKKHQHKKRALLAKRWTIGAYSTKKAFSDFATLMGLDLVMQDSDGSNQVILVDYNSDFGASSW